MNKKELLMEIKNYCKENGIYGSFNNSLNKWIVSFEIKKKKTHCKECGKKFDSHIEEGASK